MTRPNRRLNRLPAERDPWAEEASGRRWARRDDTGQSVVFHLSEVVPHRFGIARKADAVTRGKWNFYVDGGISMYTLTSAPLRLHPAAWIVLLPAVGCGGCTPDDRAASDGLSVVQAWKTRATMHRDGLGAGFARLEAVNVTGRGGFVRVEFTFRDAVLPGYTVRLTGGPLRQCGSGRPVQLSGSAVLEVRFAGAQAHTEAGASTLPDRA